MSKGEYLTMRSQQNDRSVVIKPADNEPAVVVWDRNDHLKVPERQTSDEKTYEELELQKKIKLSWWKKITICFLTYGRKMITENENNYFRFNFKKATNLGKLYILPKILKGLCKLPGRPVTSIYRTPTEKVSKFLDDHLQPIRKQGESYIRDTEDFFCKT